MHLGEQNALAGQACLEEGAKAQAQAFPASR